MVQEQGDRQHQTVQTHLIWRLLTGGDLDAVPSATVKPKAFVSVRVAKQVCTLRSRRRPPIGDHFAGGNAVTKAALGPVCLSMKVPIADLKPRLTGQPRPLPAPMNMPT